MKENIHLRESPFQAQSNVKIWQAAKIAIPQNPLVISTVLVPDSENCECGASPNRWERKKIDRNIKYVSRSSHAPSNFPEFYAWKIWVKIWRTDKIVIFNFFKISFLKSIKYSFAFQHQGSEDGVSQNRWLRAN